MGNLFGNDTTADGIQAVLWMQCSGEARGEEVRRGPGQIDRFLPSTLLVRCLRRRDVDHSDVGAGEFG